jgi:hypothetical protein
MLALVRDKLLRKFAALVLACSAQVALSPQQAAAQPPNISIVHASVIALHAAALSQTAALVRKEAAAQPPASTHQPATRARADKRQMPPMNPGQLPPLPSMLERLGGAHAKRAMQVAQGVPTGRIALRPMFWMTRDRRGAMVALGGRF